MNDEWWKGEVSTKDDRQKLMLWSPTAVTAAGVILALF
jgi:hypothetical protein